MRVVIAIWLTVTTCLALGGAASAGDLSTDELRQQALTYLDEGKTWLAEPLLLQVLRDRRRTKKPNSAAEAEALHDLAAVYVSQFRLGEAETLARKAVAADATRQHALPSLFAASLANLAEILRLRGKFIEAEKLLRQATAIDEATGGIPYATDLTNLGTLLHQVGRVAEARTMLHRSLRVLDALRGPGTDLTAILLRDLARLAQATREFTVSGSLYRRAWMLFERVHGAGSGEATMTINDLAALNAATDRTDEAIDLLSGVLAGSNRRFGRLSHEVAQALSNLGAIALQQGHMATAQQFASRSLKIFNAVLGPGSVEQAYPLGIQARHDLDHGSLALAETRMSKAESLLRTRWATSPDTIKAGCRLSRIQLLRGHVEKALATASRAMTAYRQGRITSWQQENYYGTANHETNPDIAAQAMSAAYAVARNHPHRLRQYQEMAFEFAQLQAESETAEAMEVMTEGLASGSGEIAGLLRSRRSLQARLDQLWNLVSQYTRSSDPGSRQQVALRTQEIEDTQSELQWVGKVLRTRSPRHADHIFWEPLSLQRVQDLLEPGEALVLQQPTPDGALVIAVSRKEVAWHHTLKSRKQIDDDVSRLAADLDPRHWPSTYFPYDRQSAFGLYLELWKPIEDVTRGKNRILLVSSGTLSRLPAGALVTGPPVGGRSGDGDPAALRQTAWLADRHEFAFLPAISALRTIRAHPSVSVATKPFVGFGAPYLERGNRRDVSGLPALKAAHAELTSLARSVGAAETGDVYVRHAATERWLHELDLSDRKIIAFATHALEAGELGQRNPGLVMSDPLAPDASEDGFLSTEEIAGLKLSADWVVLAGCNTAAGKDARAEPMSGLARAFFLAGARSVLVTGWSVWDDIAARVSTETLRHARNDPGRGRAAALGTAIMQLRRDPSDPRFAHPAAWAAFMLVGDPGQTEVSQQTGERMR